jgi:hypothetical protein
MVLSMAKPAAIDLAAAGLAPRVERKLLIEDIDPALVKHVVRIHPAGFREIYHQRFVNNCYFDSPDLRHLWDAMQGHSRRAKVRIRWYGELFGDIAKPVLERKGKFDAVGTKLSFALPALTFDTHSDLRVLAEWFGNAGMPKWIAPEAWFLSPVLINRYSRQYFISIDRRFRLTIDTSCKYYPAARRLPARHIGRDDLTTIIELKYAVEDDIDAAMILSEFPFRVTKSSKYVSGMNRLGYGVL